MILSSRSAPLPAGAESRLAGFTGLVATAIANAETQAEVARPGAAAGRRQASRLL